MTNTNLVNIESKPLFRSVTFNLIFLAGMFAMLGYSMYLITVSWYVINDLNSPTSVGIVLVAATIPRLTTMVFGGALADQYKKTTIMFVTHLVQAIVLFGLYLFLMTDTLTFIVLLIISALFGFLDAFFGPASSSLIPKIVHKSQLQRANSIYQGGNQVTFIIGPVIAGALMQSGSVSLSFLVASVFILISAFLVYPKLIKEAEVEQTQSKQSTWRNIKDGIKYVKHTHNLIIGIFIFITLELCVIGPIQIAIPILVKFFDGTPIQLSILEAGMGVGMIVGTILLSTFIFKRNRGALTIYGLLFIALVIILISQANSLLILTICTVLIGFGAVFIFVPFYTIAQESTHVDMMGRVMSIVYLASHGFAPVAFAIITPLVATGIHIQHILLIAGIVCLLSGILLYFNSRSYQRF
ncbi:MFS transporter [Priestia endophytica]|uniref:MFS transporter n=1 Tax=Priestia endophytica TaxID=135735 RepID=UPI001559F85F|nr:MFS transporter [Priestia endophytica]